MKSYFGWVQSYFTYKSVDLKRTLWCLDQKSKEIFLRVSALASKKSSNQKTLL